MIWSALAWDPEADVGVIVEEYGRAFMGHAYAKDVAQGLYMLEANWRGALEALGEIAKECERAGIPLLLAISPDHVQVSPQLRREIDEEYGTDSSAFDLRLRRQDDPMPKRRQGDLDHVVGHCVITAAKGGQHPRPSMHLIHFS